MIGVDALDAHAHERRRLAILERRAHGAAEPGPREEKMRADDQAERRRRTRRCGAATPTPAPTPAARGKRRGHAPGDAAPAQELGVLHGDPQPDHHQHDGVDRLAPERPEEEALAHGARHGAHCDGETDGEEEIHAGGGERGEDGVRAQRVELAVGEVDHVHQPEDEREPDPEQAIGRCPAGARSAGAGGAGPSRGRGRRRPTSSPRSRAARSCRP